MDINMDDVQKKVSALLEEITGVCNDNGICYSLYGATAAKAMACGSTNLPYASIMVDAADFRRLLDALNKNLPENRALDYMGNNKRFRYFGANYSDTSTTYINLNQGRNYYASGIYVEIIVLRSKIQSRKKRLPLSLLEQGWEGSFKHVGTFTSKRYFLASLFVLFLGLFMGREKTGRMIFEKLLSGYENNNTGKNYYVKRFSCPMINFPRYPLIRLRKVTLFEHTYNMAYYYNIFLVKTYCQNWNYGAQQPSSEGASNLLSTAVPYREMIDMLNKTEHPFESYLKKFSTKRTFHSFFRKYDKIKSRTWATAKRTGDRLTLAEYYEPKMELIRELRENGDFYRLSELMKRNRKVTVKHLNAGYGFAVNRELFEIQLEQLRLEGKNAAADKLVSITPKEYMKTIGS